MQMTQMGQPAMAPGGGYQQTTQTTISIPAPAEFARSLTEALTTSLAATSRFIVLERMALPQVQQEQDLGASGAGTTCCNTHAIRTERTLTRPSRSLRQTRQGSHFGIGLSTVRPGEIGARRMRCTS